MLRSSPLKYTNDNLELIGSKTLRLTHFRWLLRLKGITTRYISSISCEIYVSEIKGFPKGKKREESKADSRKGLPFS